MGWSSFREGSAARKIPEAATEKFALTPSRVKVEIISSKLKGSNIRERPTLKRFGFVPKTSKLAGKNKQQVLGAITFGRSSDNAIVLNHHTISKEQGVLLIFLDEEGSLNFSYQDHSSNGTKVGGKEIHNQTIPLIVKRDEGAVYLRFGFLEKEQDTPAYEVIFKYKVEY